MYVGFGEFLVIFLYVQLLNGKAQVVIAEMKIR